MLLIDLGTDIWTGVAIAYGKAEDDLMSQLLIGFSSCTVAKVAAKSVSL